MTAQAARWSSAIESRTVEPLALSWAEAAPIPRMFAMFLPLPAERRA